MGRRLKKTAVAKYIAKFGAPTCGGCGERIDADGAVMVARNGRASWARCRPCIQAWSAVHPHAMADRWRRR